MAAEACASSSTGQKIKNILRGKGEKFISFEQTLFRNLLPRRLKKSLILQTIFFIVIASITAILITGAFKYTLEYANSLESIRKNGAAISARLTYAIALPLWDFNEEQITTTIQLEMNNENISAITVTNPQGEVSGFIRNKQGKVVPIDIARDAEMLRGSDFIIAKDIVFNNSTLGMATSYFSFSAAKIRIVLSLLKDFIILFITAGVIALAVFLSLKRTVLDPIIFLKASVLNLAKKDFSTRINVESADEIGSLGQSFNEMAATIEDYNLNLQYLVKKKTDELVQAERLAALGGMVSGMAHEINTPLGTSLTAVSYGKVKVDEIGTLFNEGSMTREGFTNFIEAIKSSIDLTQENLTRASLLVDKFKRIAVDKTNEKREHFNIKHLITESIYSLEPYLSGHNYEIDINCVDSMFLDGYPVLFSQIITNLMMNSIIHGFNERNGGRVTVNAGIEGDTFSMTFYDDGIGILPQNLGRIFEPFFTTKRNQGGTGLGLSIVHNIVHHNFGGEISCQSSPENGTLFTVRFPASQ